MKTRVVFFRWFQEGDTLIVQHARETDPAGTWLPLQTLHPKEGCVTFATEIASVKRQIGNYE